MNPIAHYLQPEDICLDVETTSKADLLDAIGRHMERAHSLPHQSVTHALSRREKLGSTGLGLGVAIPHARVTTLNRVLAAYLRLKTPILFDAPDGAPVTHILVLLVPKEASDEHLIILAAASEMFANSRFRDHLLESGEVSAVKRLFDGWPDAPARVA